MSPQYFNAKCVAIAWINALIVYEPQQGNETTFADIAHPVYNLLQGHAR